MFSSAHTPARPDAPCVVAVTRRYWRPLPSSTVSPAASSLSGRTGIEPRRSADTCDSPEASQYVSSLKAPAETWVSVEPMKPNL